MKTDAPGSEIEMRCYFDAHRLHSWENWLLIGALPYGLRTASWGQEGRASVDNEKEHSAIEWSELIRAVRLLMRNQCFRGTTGGLRQIYSAFNAARDT